MGRYRRSTNGSLRPSTIAAQRSSRAHHEVSGSFTIHGKPIPPRIFADFGDAMMSHSRPIVVTIDANAAIGNNHHADPVKTKGRCVEQMKLRSGLFHGRETMSHEFRRTTDNGMLVFLAWSGGGSGTFYYLHILDAASNLAFDEDGSPTRASPSPRARTYILGDRWQGDVIVSGNSVCIVRFKARGHGVASMDQWAVSLSPGLKDVPWVASWLRNGLRPLRKVERYTWLDTPLTSR